MHTEAATIPLAAMTSAAGLYINLGLPQPWDAAKEPIPLVIYGAASAVGAYAIQLAQRSNIHPLICVAGKSSAHVETLIDRSKGDVILDYREGDDALVENLKKAAAASGKPLLHALDAVSEGTSTANLGKVLGDGAKVSLVLPLPQPDALPATVEHSGTMVARAHKDDKDFAYVYFRYFARGLAEGWLKGQPQVVVPGGLGGVEEALKNLKAGKANGIKYVFRIAETEGVE